MSAARPFSWGLTALSAGIINTLINAPIGWAMVKDGTRLGVWAVPGVVPDLLVTAFGVAFGTSLVVTPVTRKQVAKGLLLPPELPGWARRWFASWPRHPLIRAFNLGVFSVLVFTPLPLLALRLLAVPDADRLTVTLIKGGFSFIDGALMTPMIAAAATVERSASGE